MTQDLMDPFAGLRRRVTGLHRSGPVGRIRRLTASGFEVEGLSDHARLGDDLRYETEAGLAQRAEVVRIDGPRLWATPFGISAGLRIDLPVHPGGVPRLNPCDGWIGRVVDPFGRALDGRPLPLGPERDLVMAPPGAAARRGMGMRLETGLPVIDTMLPIVAGQRMGLFAGSGVGKSTLIATLAQRMEADVCVLALVGERGREVADLTQRILGPGAMARTVTVVATADQPASLRRRCAFSAMAVAEHFRDAGQRVLLLCDSVTRLAEAHREMAAAAGEACDLRGHPASLGPLLAGLVERAGPGEAAQGDITAVFSVLVPGSDMEEPVADMLRGQLDGHIVLSRDIAESGRFPAVDVLRSVSRSLPGAASATENAIIAEVRRLIAVQDRNSLMVSSGLYERGSDPKIDRAMAIMPRLEGVFATSEATSAAAAFAQLAGTLGLAHDGPSTET